MGLLFLEKINQDSKLRRWWFEGWWRWLYM